MALKVTYKGTDIIDETADCVKKLDTAGCYMEDDVTIDYTGGVTPAPELPEILTKHILVDYDGTLLYEYSLTEIQQLTELPNPPAHEGLTFQGWNWTLADLKNETVPIVVGAIYYSTFNGIKLYITLDNVDNLNTGLLLGLNGTCQVDWGDGSAVEEYTATLIYNDALEVTHQYESVGDYIIAIKVVSGQLGGKYENASILFDPLKGSINSNTIGAHYYNRYITKVEIGDFEIRSTAFYRAFSDAKCKSINIPNKSNDLPYNIILGGIGAKFIAFSKSSIFSYGSCPTLQTCPNIKLVSLPKFSTTIPSYFLFSGYSLTAFSAHSAVTDILSSAFQNATTLKQVILSSAVTIGSNAFAGCSSLVDINLPNGITALESSAFSNCSALENIALPITLKTIKQSAFAGCQSLQKIKIPLLTSCGNGAFAKCYAMQLYDFTDWTTNDIDACTFGTIIFSDITAGTEIRFKYKSVRDYAAQVSNLVSYASYMTYEEDDT